MLFPLIGFFEKIVVKIFPGKDVTVHKNALHLDSILIQTPPLALEQSKKELTRVTKIAHTMLKLSFERLSKRDALTEKKILDRESAVDSITEDIIRYLTRVSQKTLGMRLSNQLTSLLHFAYLIKIKEDNNMTLSKTETEELDQAFDRVNYMFKTLITGIEDNSLAKLEKCEEIEVQIDEIVKVARTNHLMRLRNEEYPPHSGVFFADTILHLERIGDLLYAISRNLIDIK